MVQTLNRHVVARAAQVRVTARRSILTDDIKLLREANEALVDSVIAGKRHTKRFGIRRGTACGGGGSHRNG